MITDVKLAARWMASSSRTLAKEHVPDLEVIVTSGKPLRQRSRKAPSSVEAMGALST